MKKYLFGVLLFIFPILIQAQPVKYGKIEKEDFTIQLSSEDSSSNAVILFDYSEINPERDERFKIIRHFRIRVLNPGDMGLGEFEYSFNKPFYGQEFKKIEATSYNLRNGKIQKKKLSRDNIFEEEEFAGWASKKFAVPDIEEGTIFEVRYEFMLGSPDQIPNWYFDKEYPVKWSEFKILLPVYYRFSLVQSVNRDFYRKEVKDTKTSLRISNYRAGFSSHISSPAQEFRWVMRNVPALEEEPYISSIQNYRNFVYLQFNGIEIPQYQISATNNETWQKFASSILSDRYLGEDVAPDEWSNKLAESICGNESSDREKLECIHSYINDFSVNSFSAYYPQKRLRTVDSNQSGSKTELNLLLIKLLRSSGISVDLVFLSTRNNGKVLKEYVLADQFNKLIARVKLDDEYYLIDASSNIPSILLPLDNLNGEGLIASKSNSVWTKLENNFQTGTDINVRAKISSNGSISGSVQVESEGYHALRLDEEYNSEDVDYLNSHIFTQPIVSEFDSISYSSMSYYNPQNSIEANFVGSISSDSTLDDIIYIQPAGFDFLGLPSLENQGRRFPIEFPFGQRIVYKIRIEIPDGYAIEDLPSGNVISIPGKRFNYVDSYLKFSDAVVIERKFLALDTEFKQDQYPIIKAIIGAVNAPTATIVLKKNE